MQLGIRPQRHVLADRLLEILEHGAFLVAERAGDVGVDPQQQALAVEVGADLLHLRMDSVAARRARLADRAPSAVRTRLGERALQTLLHALPRDDDEAEVRHRNGLRRGTVFAQLVLDRLQHLLPVFLVLHVDEVEDDDAAEVAQPDLPHDLLGGLEVGLEDGVLEPAGGLLADVAAGVDVDRHQRLGRVDHDRAAGLEPHLAAQRLVDLGLHAVLLEDRERLLVETHLRRERRHDALDELENLAVLVLVVDANGRELLGEQIPQELRHQAGLAVDDRRRPRGLGLLPDLGPDLVEVAQVRDDVLFRPAARGGADDDAAGEAVLLAELADDAAQAAALLARVDLPRHADVVHGRHEHQKAARHRGMAGQAGALRAQRLLRHLHDDLLRFLDELFDLGLGAFLALAAPAAAAAALPTRGAGPGYRAGLVAVGGRVVFVRLEAVELLEGGDNVGNVEKAVAFETEVNERRLHAGQDFRYPALVKVAHHPARPLALDEYFGNLVLLEDRDPCFVGARGDDHLLGHARCSVAGPEGAAAQTPVPARPAYRRAARARRTGRAG